MSASSAIAHGLVRALRGLAELAAQPHSPRLANTLATARLIAAAALKREESRGGHYRDDFPDERPEWQPPHVHDAGRGRRDCRRSDASAFAGVEAR